MHITASGGCPSTEAAHRSVCDVRDVRDVHDVRDESESVHTHTSTWACVGALLTHGARGGCRPCDSLLHLHIAHTGEPTSPGQAWGTPVAPEKGQGRTHIAQVQDEAVAVVEALPGHRHLGGSDHTPPFDLEESLHHHLVGDHVLES